MPSATTRMLSRFAHLTGGVAGRGKAADEEEDDKKKKPGEESENASEGEDEDDKKKKEGESDDDMDADDDMDEDDMGDDEQDPKKKAKALAFARKIRMAERRRCAAIFAHPAAAYNLTLTAELAFATNLKAAAACAVLGTSPAPTRVASGLAGRMAATTPITIGADLARGDQTLSDQDAARALASTIIADARASGVIRK